MAIPQPDQKLNPSFLDQQEKWQLAMGEFLKGSAKFSDGERSYTKIIHFLHKKFDEEASPQSDMGKEQTSNQVHDIEILKNAWERLRTLMSNHQDIMDKLTQEKKMTQQTQEKFHHLISDLNHFVKHDAAAIKEVQLNGSLGDLKQILLTKQPIIEMYIQLNANKKPALTGIPANK